MRPHKAALWVTGLLAIGFSAVLALGAPAPTKSEAVGEAAEETESEPTAADDDLGEPPPADQGAEKERASPLNPEPEEFPDGGVAPPPGDYNSLMADIAALRSRVAALTTTLFASKLRVVVRTDDEASRIQSLSVTLDDGIVYAAPEGFSAEEERTVYEHAVAPGHHVVGVEVERYDPRAKQFKTWQSSKFSVVVPEKSVLQTTLTLEDESGMAEDFPAGEDGEYELNVRLRAEVVE
ncbi:MAG TPA: hypothetical protein VF989_05215 [Polyangiaceae bacterium]